MTVEGNAPEGYARITEGYGDTPASPKPFPPQMSPNQSEGGILTGHSHVVVQP
jgi:hypothetical protein